MMMSIVPLLFSAMVMMTAAVTYIDSSAVQALKDLYQEYKLRDIQVE
jgi:sulfate transporter 4